MEDYEKKYKEALSRAATELETCGADKSLRNMIYAIFPDELKESKDERIRKMLIDSFTRADMGGEIYGKGVTYKQVIAWLEKQGNQQDKGEISDGYHTFNELYYYRMLYNAAFFNMLPKEWVHKSKRHNDGEECFGGGWFIVMANLPTGQISNHYELKDWDLFQIPEKEVADKWDGHTPQEAADRLHKYLLEKQSSSSVKWQKNTPNNKPAINHSVLMKTTQGIAEGEWQGEHWFQYRWSWTLKDSDVLAWMELSNLDEQGEQKPAVVDFNAKDWYVSKVDGKIHDMTYNPADKVEQKFKVKYAGSEYNVLEVKDIAGVTFYGIEDEPNHIDYVKADNCEIISGYGIKKNGSPYPTKPSMFSEQKPAWSEEDEKIRKALVDALNKNLGNGIEKYGTTLNAALTWLEKQGSQQPIIIWHSVSEEPEEMKELFCEWESDDATWHDVAFYDEESKTFRHAKMPINVTKWVYVDELLERQGEQKPFDYESANIQQKDFAPKQEWSEKDDKIYYSLLADIRTRQDDSTSTLEAYYNEQIDWLKSLKDRIGG